MKGELIPFFRPSIGPAEEQAVLAVLRSGWLTTGARAHELERRISHLCGVPGVVATSSCTAALHLSLLGLDVGPGDEVITSPITFPSTANVVVHTGATPVFCDVAPDTLNLDAAALERAITKRTRAVIAVHFAGHPCDMDAINAVAGARGVPVIEDAAHAIGASFRGRPVGSLGRAAAFSFYATKNVTTVEGGMLVTDDAALAERAALLSSHGLSADAWKRHSGEGYRHWEVLAAGYKYNLPDVLAAIGLAQLDRLEELTESRRLLVERYDELLADVPHLQPLGRRPDVSAACHLYVVRVGGGAPLSRDQLLQTLEEQGVGVGVHFRALHLHPFYRQTYGFGPGMCPVAEAAGEQVVSLPLFPGLTEGQLQRVADVCGDAMRGG